MFQRRESCATESGRQRLPLLRNATLTDLETEIEYKTGACYKGQVYDNKKVGYGVFTWPNGAKYEGEFIDNARQGKGIQTFEDGTIYDGEFNEDMRHGQGKIMWPNKETYTGKFFKDRRHGYGTYYWPDGSHYNGMFYMDRKEGYGAFHFADTTKFEGLYKGDERFGPGVQTYSNGHQDVGLWHREKLVKLCGNVKGAFTIIETEFCDSVDNEKMYIYPEYLQNRTDVIHSIMNPPEEFSYPPKVDIKTKTVEEIFNEALDARSLAVDIRAFDESFFDEAIKSRLAKRSAKSRTGRSTALSAKSAKSEQNRASSSAKKDAGKPGSAKKPSAPPSRQNSAKSQASIRSVSTVPLDVDEDVEEEEPVLVWNKTPSCVAMQKHVIRHQPSEKNVTFDVNKIIDGCRSGFGEPGAIELVSLEFLEAAMKGDANKVSDLLIAEKVHVDVADKTGHTALMGAAVHCHEDVINCLLDSGSDVNKLNDEGISCLAACHIYFYPSERFKYNIAENEGTPPEDMEKEPGYDVNEAVKGFLSNKRSGAVNERKQTHEEKLEDQKITKLRKEYGGMFKSKESLDKTTEFTNSVTGEQSILSKHSDKQLGTLKFKRAVRINVDDIMAIDDNPPESDRDSLLQYTGRGGFDSDASDDRSSDVGPEEFASEASVRNYPIEISNQLIERCATGLSTNEMVVGRARSAKSDPSSLGTVRRLAIDKREHVLMETTIRLLLRRGADPNSSTVPMPVLFFAVKAADVEAVRLLLLKGASTQANLPDTKNGLAPLHIAVALPGEEGVQITELLLNSLADPDARAVMDESFLNRNLSSPTWSITTGVEPELINLTSSRSSISRRSSRIKSITEEEWCKDVISDESRLISGGRTPLHISCARDDNYKNACKVVHLLLDHHANPNLLCNGHSPLALAIASGNDLAIEELLVYQSDPNLVLTHGVGSALCVASSTEYEHRRNPESRLKLIDKLVKCGADILSPIPIGPKRLTGSAVDYSYYMYNLDRRIAHMPYHALSHAERETYNARRKLLAHMGDILRTKAVEREKQRLMYEGMEGRRSCSPSSNFVYMGSGQSLPQGMVKSSKIAGRAVLASDSKVSFSGVRRQTEGDIRKLSKGSNGSNRSRNKKIRKPLLRYCYECGRSVGVRLSACTRCKEVYYCSKVCKVKAWNARHKEECIRIGGQSMSPAKDVKDRVDSPTPQTDAERGKPTTVTGIIGPQTRIKLHLYPGAGANVIPGTDPQHDLALNLDFQGQRDMEVKGGIGEKKANFDPNPVVNPKSLDSKLGVLNQGKAKGIPKGKKLEYLGSFKLQDLKGKGQGHGAKGNKAGKTPPSKMLNMKNKKKAPLYVDPITGMIRTVDPVSGKVIWMDNYSFV